MMRRLSSIDKRLVSYAVGFISSVILTVIAYALVVNDTIVRAWTAPIVAIVIAILASLQLIVQLIFFMHLSEERRPRWKLMSFVFAFVILGIIVFGSLWIMFDLNDRMMMSPTEMIKYMNKQTGI
ncbi:MAG TPA: cytochrome o ubiquinol oxidase subunit IV [Candidatus Saccharimonadales bacterium]